MSSEQPHEEQELARPVGGVKCLHCDDWGCRRCQPQPDPGEQGLTVEEKKVIALETLAEALRVSLVEADKRVLHEMARAETYRRALLRIRDDSAGLIGAGIAAETLREAP